MNARNLSFFLRLGENLDGSTPKWECAHKYLSNYSKFNAGFDDVSVGRVTVDDGEIDAGGLTAGPCVVIGVLGVARGVGTGEDIR